MPKTLDKTFNGQIIGGIFSSPENADKAVKAFEDLDITPDNIEVIVQLDEKQVKEPNYDMLTDRGFSDYQAHYYDKVISEGKTLVVVYEVTDAALIIDVFDKYKA